MLFNIPQFIDKEDKIVGPLTAKQLGWMGGAGTILLVLFGILDMAAFLIASVFVVGIFGALAFYRPNNQPLIVFIMSSIYFAVRPKMYIWKRLPEKPQPVKKITKKVENVSENKSLNKNRLEEISNLLDRN